MSQTAEIESVSVTKYTEGGAIEYGELNLKIKGHYIDVKILEADLLEFLVKYLFDTNI